MNKKQDTEYTYCDQEGCNGKVALASGVCMDLEPDQEPFKNGELIELERTFEYAEIYVNAHICTECEHVQDAWVEEPYNHPKVALYEVEEALDHFHDWWDKNPINPASGLHMALLPLLEIYVKLKMNNYEK